MAEKITNEIVRVLKKAREPLETSEVTDALRENDKSVTRARVLYRLFCLLGEQLINGKSVGSGKGCWIWWKK